MPRFRRVVAAFSCLFLLQLVLQGSGTLCAMHHAMAMAGMTHQTSSHEHADRDGCHLPFAPSQCSSMAACDVTAAPATLTATIERVATGAMVVPAAPLGHSGPTFAPELPPPRA